MGGKRRPNTRHQDRTWQLAQAARLREYFEPAQRRTLALLVAYIDRHGWDAFTTSIRWRGVKLGQWVADRRRDYRAGKLPGWLAEALEDIPGWHWEPERARHQRALDALRAHVERTGELPRPGQVVVDDVDLSVWMRGRRKAHRAGTIPGWLHRELEAIDAWTWRGRRERFPKPPPRKRKRPRRAPTAPTRRPKRSEPTQPTPRRRDPRALLVAAQALVGKPPATVIEDLAELSGWIDRIGAETRSRLPAAVKQALRRESRGRK